MPAFGCMSSQSSSTSFDGGGSLSLDRSSVVPTQTLQYPRSSAFVDSALAILSRASGSLFAWACSSSAIVCSLLSSADGHPAPTGQPFIPLCLAYPSATLSQL